MAAQEMRDEMPDEVLYAPREARSWRPRQSLTGVVSGAPFTGDDAANTTYAEHGGVGTPDPRRRYDTGTPAYPGAPSESLRPGPPEEFANYRAPVSTPGSNGVPDRPRAGSTGADPARPAEMPHWQSSRPFDQWAAQHMSGLDKIPEAPPTAGTPIWQGDATAGAVPYPGGTGDPVRGMTGVGIQPNSVRFLPRAWDEQLVNVAETPDTWSRERGWRR